MHVQVADQTQRQGTAVLDTLNFVRGGYTSFTHGGWFSDVSNQTVDSYSYRCAVTTSGMLGFVQSVAVIFLCCRFTAVKAQLSLSIAIDCLVSQSPD